MVVMSGLPHGYVYHHLYPLHLRAIGVKVELGKHRSMGVLALSGALVPQALREIDCVMSRMKRLSYSSEQITLRHKHVE